MKNPFLCAGAISGIAVGAVGVVVLVLLALLIPLCAFIIHLKHKVHKQENRKLQWSYFKEGVEIIIEVRFD